MRTSCPSCGTEVETDDGRWCPNPDCGAYISWDEEDDTASEAASTRRPGEQGDPPPPPQDPTTVIPAVEPRVGCPACGTDNPQDRSLCQHCGSPLQATPSPPPPPPQEREPSGIGTGWLIGGGLAILLVGALAFMLLGGDGDDGTEPLAGGPSPEASATPSPSVESAPPATPMWIAILRSMDIDTFGEGDAEDHAADVAAAVGAEPAVLRSGEYASLNPGYWVVYVGGFETQGAASAFCDGIVDTVPDCYERLIE